MAPAVLVEVGFETVRHAWPFAIIGTVASAARCTGSAATTGVGTFPRAGDMGFADPAGVVTARAFDHGRLFHSPRNLVWGPLNLGTVCADTSVLGDCNFQFQQGATKQPFQAWWRFALAA
jgi:hypothetical protein